MTPILVPPVPDEVTAKAVRWFDWILGAPLQTLITIAAAVVALSIARWLVTRNPIASTMPVACPTSITSPTPYWSSISMKIPDRKSFTSA